LRSPIVTTNVIMMNVQKLKISLEISLKFKMDMCKNKWEEPFDISLDLMSLVNLLVQFASSKTLWQLFNRYYHQQLQFGHDLWPFTYLTLRSDAPSESSGFYVLHPEPFDIRSLLCSSCTQKNHFFTLLSWLVTRKSLTLWVVVIYNKQQHIQTN
jgi:hypothetical protein